MFINIFYDSYHYQSQFGQNIYVHLKYHGLLDSELPLATCKPLKKQSFGIFADSVVFFCISTINVSQTVNPKFI